MARFSGIRRRINDETAATEQEFRFCGIRAIGVLADNWLPPEFRNLPQNFRNGKPA
jgi:hypothetical protein